VGFFRFNFKSEMRLLFLRIRKASVCMNIQRQSKWFVPTGMRIFMWGLLNDGELQANMMAGAIRCRRLYRAMRCYNVMIQCELKTLVIVLSSNEPLDLASVGNILA
jgi:hypothetical protein